MTGTPWIRSARWDGAFILLPMTLPALAVLALPGMGGELSPWHWVALVLCVDVAHVWSTLAVTYLKPGELRRRPALYLLTPLACFAVALAVHLVGGPAAFWRALAYLAVFHFVRQQYGLLRIYSRGAPEAPWAGALSAAALYASVGAPLLLWHLDPDRAFHWFAEGDFVDLGSLLGNGLTNALRTAVPLGLVAVLAAFGLKELAHARRTGAPQWGRAALVSCTALTWWTGIEVAHGDLAFTATNVLAHGLPYLAIVYWSRHITAPLPEPRVPVAWAVALAAILMLAWVEEGLWAGLLWREHEEVFGPFFALPALESPPAVSLAVAVLAVPQLTHYVLDGVIWKGRGAWTRG